MNEININVKILKKCLKDCKQAGDQYRDDSLYIPAAIMIIFSLYENKNQIIIIRRKRNLRKHGGQIAFPGGKFENFILEQDIALHLF